MSETAKILLTDVQPVWQEKKRTPDPIKWAQLTGVTHGITYLKMYGHFFRGKPLLEGFPDVYLSGRKDLGVFNIHREYMTDAIRDIDQLAQGEGFSDSLVDLSEDLYTRRLIFEGQLEDQIALVPTGLRLRSQIGIQRVLDNVAGAMHDLRGCLTLFYTTPGLIERAMLGDDVPDSLIEKMKKNYQNMNAILKQTDSDLFDWYPAKKYPVSLVSSAVRKGLVGAFKREYFGENPSEAEFIRIDSTEIDQIDYEVLDNEGVIDRLMFNLGRNLATALKDSTDPWARISLEPTQDRQFLRLRILNPGQFPEEIVAKGYQKGMSRSGREGSKGVGMASQRKIRHMLGGDIIVANTPEGAQQDILFKLSTPGGI